MTKKQKTDLSGPLELLLRSLNLKGIEESYAGLAEQAAQQGLSYESFLYEALKVEAEQRRNRRSARLLRESRLPLDKRLDNFDFGRVPTISKPLIGQLADGSLVERAENVLAFGNPGTGKTHLLCGLGHELIAKGHSVFCTKAYALVQELVAARRDMRLPQALRRLDRFDVLLIDDLGCQKHEAGEMEVLFTLFSERYERRSLLITSNLVFSKWDEIFGDAMRTTAAIDRLIHHGRILELNTESYRAAKARERRRSKDDGEKTSGKIESK